jgi:hypothetical protein
MIFAAGIRSPEHCRIARRALKTILAKAYVIHGSEGETWDRFQPQLQRMVAIRVRPLELPSGSETQVTFCVRGVVGFIVLCA